MLLTPAGVPALCVVVQPVPLAMATAHPLDAATGALVASSQSVASGLCAWSARVLPSTMQTTPLAVSSNSLCRAHQVRAAEPISVDTGAVIYAGRLAGCWYCSVRAHGQGAARTLCTKSGYVIADYWPSGQYSHIKQRLGMLAALPQVCAWLASKPSKHRLLNAIAQCSDSALQ